MNRSKGQPVCLGDVCEIVSALVDPREKNVRSLLHVGGANIESTTGRLINVQSAEHENLISGKHLFGEHDVLYSKIRPYLRKVALPTFTGLCSADIYPLRPVETRLHRKFLFYLLLSAEFTEYANRVSNRAGMPKINREQLFAFKTVLPSLTEQARIVERVEELMARVDEIRRLRSESEVAAVALLPSLLKEQFVGLDTKYASIPLERVLLESRYGTSEKCEASFNGTPVLRIPNVAGRRCNFDDLKFLARSIPAGDSLLLRSGDLLVVRTNGSPALVGRCAVVPPLDGSYGYASYLIRFRLDENKARPKYVSYFLSSTRGRDQIAKLRRTSAGQYNINSESLRSIVVPLPPIAVQDAMVERMDRIDASVRDVQARLAAENTKDALLPDAVLRKAFAGEL